MGSDHSQLANTAQAAKEALKVETLEAVADRGYFNGEKGVADGTVDALAVICAAAKAWRRAGQPPPEA